jgi:anaerobic nitric oxide reductase flavorubredoxin
MNLGGGLHWVGVEGLEVRPVHGPGTSTAARTAFNSFLIQDESSACVGCLRPDYTPEVIRQIRLHLDPARLAFLIPNYDLLFQPGALNSLRSHFPRAQLVVPACAREALAGARHASWEYRFVRTGERLSLGRRRLLFIESPLLLWPGSMLTYLEGSAVLLSAELFGQHQPGTLRFSDQADPRAVDDAARRYFASFFAASSERVVKKMDELEGAGLRLRMIAPYHGLIWRREPRRILRRYRQWSQQVPERRAVILYDTMLKSTQYMAEAVARGVEAEGIPCRMFRISISDLDEMAAEILRARAIILGSPTLHRGLLPSVAPVLQLLSELGLSNRIGAAFGSYGWSGESLAQLEAELRIRGITPIAEGVLARMRPGADELQRCEDLGRKAAQAVKRMPSGHLFTEVRF